MNPDWKFQACYEPTRFERRRLIAFLRDQDVPYTESQEDKRLNALTISSRNLDEHYDRVSLITARTLSAIDEAENNLYSAGRRWLRGEPVPCESHTEIPSFATRQRITKFMPEALERNSAAREKRRADLLKPPEQEK